MWDKFYREGRTRQLRLGLDLEDANEPVISRDTITYYVDQLLQKLEAADPTPHKEYVQWMARTYGKGGVYFEDVITQVAQGLQIFDRLKKRRLIPQPYNDINRYPDFHSFDQVVSEYEDKLPAENQTDINKGDAKEVYRDEQLRVVQPEDQTAACYYGRGTRWCTAGTSSANMFNQYHKDGPLYIIIPAKVEHVGEKYQFHFPSLQFMNEKDQQIDVHDLVTKYPQLQKLFKSQAKQFGALQFFFSRDDVTKIMELLLPRIAPEMKSYILRNLPKIAKEIAEDLIGQFKGLKSFREEMYEILPDDIRNSVEYYYRAVAEDAKMHPEILSNVDAFWDMTLESDQLREFAGDSEISVFIHEILDLDDDEGSFEIDQSLNGTLQGYYAKAVHEAWKKVSKQYLKI
jgi:hypothetical protein